MKQTLYELVSHVFNFAVTPLKPAVMLFTLADFDPNVSLVCQIKDYSSVVINISHGICSRSHVHYINSPLLVLGAVSVLWCRV